MSDSKASWSTKLPVIAWGLAAVAVYDLAPKLNDAETETGALILLAVFVGLPLWGFHSTKFDVFRWAAILWLAFAALLSILPPDRGGSADSGGCEVAWDGRTNPTVCY